MIALFSIIVQLYSQNHELEFFESSYRGMIRGTISASFNTKKRCSRVLSSVSVLFVKQRSSVSEPPFRGLAIHP